MSNKDIRELDTESRPPLQEFSTPHVASSIFLGASTLVAGLCFLIEGFVIAGLVIFIVGFLGSGSLVYHSRKKKKRGVHLRPPHQVYPEILKWEKGDRVEVNDPYCDDSYGLWSVVDGYYQGVLNDYSVLFSDERSLSESENTYRVTADTLRIVDNASFSSGVRNLTLRKRNKKVTKSNAEELLENSNYNELLEELKAKHLELSSNTS